MSNMRETCLAQTTVARSHSYLQRLHCTSCCKIWPIMVLHARGQSDDMDKGNKWRDQTVGLNIRSGTELCMLDVSPCWKIGTIKDMIHNLTRIPVLMQNLWIFSEELSNDRCLGDVFDAAYIEPMSGGVFEVYAELITALPLPDSMEVWIEKLTKLRFPFDANKEDTLPPQKMLASREFMMRCVRINAHVLAYAPMAIKEDREIVLEAVAAEPPAIIHASSSLRRD